MENTKNIVFYDGDCGFCNFWIQWILDHDKENKFRFSALQNSFGQKFLNENKFSTENFKTLYLKTKEGEILEKSDAVIKIGSILGSYYQLLVIGKIIPKFLRNKIYDKVSENRQELASAKCLLPTPEERKKFI